MYCTDNIYVSISEERGEDGPISLTLTRQTRTRRISPDMVVVIH